MASSSSSPSPNHHKQLLEFDETTTSNSCNSNKKYFFSEADAKDLVVLLAKNHNINCQDTNNNNEEEEITVLNMLFEKVKKIQERIGSESNWNQLLSKHLTIKKNDTTVSENNKTIFESCNQIEILMLLLDAKKVTRLTSIISSLMKNTLHYIS